MSEDDLAFSYGLRPLLITYTDRRERARTAVLTSANYNLLSDRLYGMIYPDLPLADGHALSFDCKASDVEIAVFEGTVGEFAALNQSLQQAGEDALPPPFEATPAPVVAPAPAPAPTTEATDEDFWRGRRGVATALHDSTVSHPLVVQDLLTPTLVQISLLEDQNSSLVLRRDRFAWRWEL